MPPAKWLFSSLALRLARGRTAMVGLSSKSRAEAAAPFVSSRAGAPVGVGIAVSSVPDRFPPPGEKRDDGGSAAQRHHAPPREARPGPSLRNRRRRLQRGANLPRPLIPLRGVFLQTLANDGLQPVGDRLRQRRRRVAQNGRRDLRAGGAGERPLPPEHLVAQDTQRPDVRPRVRRFPAQRLRCHIRQDIMPSATGERSRKLSDRSPASSSSTSRLSAASPSQASSRNPARSTSGASRHQLLLPRPISF